MANKLQFILDFKTNGAELINKNIESLKNFATSAKNLISSTDLLSSSLNNNTKSQNNNKKAAEEAIKKKKEEKKLADDLNKSVKEQAKEVARLEKEQKKLAAANQQVMTAAERTAYLNNTKAIKEQTDAAKLLLDQKRKLQQENLKRVTDEEKKAAEEAAAATKKYTDANEKLGETISKSVKVGIAAVIVQLTAMIAYMKVASDQFGELNVTAKNTGVSFEYLQSLKDGFNSAGISVEEYADNLNELNKRITEGASLGSGPAIEYLELLNLDAKELSKLKPEEQFEKINEQMKALGVTASQRKQIFGELGGDALFSVSENLDDIKEKSDKLKETGLIMTAGEVEGLSAFSDKISEASTRLSAFAGIISGQVLPIIVELFSENDGDILDRDSAEEATVMILDLLKVLKQLVIYTKQAWALIAFYWKKGVSSVGDFFDEMMHWFKDLTISIAVFVEDITSIDIVGMLKDLGLSAMESLGNLFRTAVDKILGFAQTLMSKLPFFGEEAAAAVGKARKKLAEMSNEKEIAAAQRKENDEYRKANDQRVKDIDSVNKKLKAANDKLLQDKKAARKKAEEEDLNDLKSSIEKQINEQDKLDNTNSFAKIQENKAKSLVAEAEKKAAEDKKKTELENKNSQDKNIAALVKEIDLINSKKALNRITSREAVEQTEAIYKKIFDLSTEYKKSELELNTIQIAGLEVRKKYNEDEKKLAEENKRKQEEAIRKAKEESDKRIQSIKDEMKNNQINNEIIGESREVIYNRNLAFYDKILQAAIDEKRTELEINEIRFERFNYIKQESDFRKKSNEDVVKVSLDLQIRELESQGKKLEAMKLQTAEKRKQLELSLKDASEDVRNTNLSVFDKVENIDYQKAKIDQLNSDIEKLSAKRLNLNIFDNSDRIKIEDEINSKMKERSAIMEEIGIKQEDLSENLSFTVKDFEGLLNTAYGSMSTLISDTISGTKSLKESFSELFSNLLKYLLQVYQRLLVMKALKMLGMATGGGTGDVLSSVFDGASSRSVEKFHVGGINKPGDFSSWAGGLNSDEFPAILQKGEALVTEKQQANISAALQSENNSSRSVVNNIVLDSSSLADAISKTESFEQGVIRAYNRNTDALI